MLSVVFFVAMLVITNANELISQYACNSCKQLEETSFVSNSETKSSVIVIDDHFGHVMAGFAGNAAPSIDYNVDFDGGYLHESADWELVTKAFDDLFSSKLKVDAKGRDVVLTVHPRTLTKNKEMIAKIFFEHFEVNKLFLMYRHELAIHTQQGESGTVIDMNDEHEEVAVVPVYDGFVVYDALEYAPYNALPQLNKMIRDSMEAVEDDLRDDVSSKYMVITDNLDVSDCVCLNGFDPMPVYNDTAFVWTQGSKLYSSLAESVFASAWPWVSINDYLRCGPSAIHSLCAVDHAFRRNLVYNHSAHIVNMSSLIGWPGKSAHDNGHFIISAPKPLVLVCGIILLILWASLTMNVYFCAVRIKNKNRYKVVNMVSETENES